MVLLLIVFYKKGTIDYTIGLIPPASEIAGSEDLMSRQAYEQLLLSDPKTGRIPKRIVERETRFANAIYKKTEGAKTQSLPVESIGPTNVGGRTRAVAFDIRDEDIILAGGVSGGVWKSVNGGATWIKKSHPNNRNSVTCIVQDTRIGHEDTWYHGTGEIVGNSSRGGAAPFRGNGIYKSVDNGESWQAIASTQDADPNIFNSQFQYIWNIVVNDQNQDEDELLVAAFGGILRSLDGGNSWEVALGKKLFNLADSIDLNTTGASFYSSVAQSNTGLFFATLSTESNGNRVSSDAGIYVSTNAVDWNEITPFSADSRYRRIAIGPSTSAPNIAYFLVDSSPALILKLSLSISGSDISYQFEQLETPNFKGLGAFDTQGSYNMMIKVHPENQNLVYAGGTNLYRSTDGFSTSENIKWIGGYDPDGGTAVYLNHHPDQHDLLFYPSNPNKVLSASDGGLIVSADGTADSVFWTGLNDGYVTSQFFTIAQSKVEGDPALIGGMQDNGTDISSGGSNSWQGIIGGDGAFAATTRDQSLWFASFQRGQTLRLTLDEKNEVTSFGRVDPGTFVTTGNYLFINPFVLDPQNENRIFVAGGQHLYHHPNVSQIPGGSQQPTPIGWSRVTRSSDVTQGGVSSVEISHSSEVVYFGTSSGQLFKVLNADDGFNMEAQEISSFQFLGGYVSCIAVNPENADHILVIFSNYNIPSIYESLDGGSTFSDISGNLEENPDGSGDGPSIRWAEIIPTNSGVLYLVGTSTGLYSTMSGQNGEVEWLKESPNLIGSAIIPMMDYRPVDGRLAIATHGNGVFVSFIPDFKRIAFRESESKAFSTTLAAPNPFNEQTKIQFSTPEDGTVKVDIYALDGKLINNILWAHQFAGVNEVAWDGSNAAGTPLHTGVYFYRILYKDQVLSGKLLLRR